MRTSGSLPSVRPPSSPLRSGTFSEPGVDPMSVGTSPTDIQSHIYHAFLNGRTADVSLRVRGSWEGMYRLHRVVLIQAGFFSALFDGGFREASGQQGAHDDVSVIFDDPNITRAAFEVCISRLYGGGPALHVDPSLVPSRKEPLTSSFPRPVSPSATPAGHHPASPRFLLALLATAIYLSIPSLVSQAILLVLNSLGPYTVIRYLNFAIGKGIGEKGDNELDAPVGLEDLCRDVRHPGMTRSISIRSSASKQSRATVTQVFNDLGPVEKEEATDTDSSHTYDKDRISTEQDADDDGPAFMYGPPSNKIGEAVACWLCRWGADMFFYEEAVESVPPGPAQERNGSRHRSATESSVAGPPVIVGLAKEHVPIIWRRGGMNASWARAILSSDSFFVRDERDRYDIACRVVELRRRCSINEAEEREWEDLFANGIHYMHMALEDLIDISQDISPTTGKTFAPPTVIQAAHWDQSILRHHITYRPNSSSPSTPPHSPTSTRDSLGLSQSTTEILATLSTSQPGGITEPHKAFHPVPVDSSSRIGDTTGLDGASMDQLFGTDGALFSPGKGNGKGKNRLPNTPANFFGILSERRTAAGCVEVDNTGTALWAPFPPIRFGVEFWGLDALQEKERLTSQTVWYAGSLFNVYVQVVRKKGLQLGMYLHRLSSVETIPLPSAPPLVSAHADTVVGVSRHATVQPVNIPTSISTPSLYRSQSRGTTAGPSRSSTPASSPGGARPRSSPSSTSLNASPTTGAGTGLQGSPRPTAQPYRDPREAVRAHFTLLCAAPTGAALTRFASAPDAFHVGRSWGWKSSALQTEEHLAEGELESSSRECSLRATVVLGVV